MKRENSRLLGVALSHIINDRLGKVHPVVGPVQPSREGAIIGGFFQGLFSQNKNGLATWASKYIGNRLGNRNLNPEIKTIIMKFLGNPKNPVSQQEFMQSIIRLYQKMPNSSTFGSKKFRNGLRKIANTARHPMMGHIIKTAWASTGANRTPLELARSAAMRIPAVQNAAVRTARAAGTAIYRGIERIGHKEEGP